MTNTIARRKVTDTIVESTAYLLSSRTRFGGYFSDNDEKYGARGERGPVASLQGLRTVFGATAALLDEREELWARIVKPHLADLISEWRRAISELRDTNFRPDPYDSDGQMQDLLADEKPTGVYTDAVSWALSTSVVLHFVLSELQRKQKADIDAEVLNELRGVIADELHRLVSIQRPDGGWGWSGGAPESHIYFTWTALGGLADYDDYVAGGTPQIAAPNYKLLEFIDEREAGLAERANAVWDRALKFLEPYLDQANSRDLVAEDFYKTSRIVKYDLGDRTWDKAYYELYLLEMLVLVRYDAPGGKPLPANVEKLRQFYQKTIRTFTDVVPLADRDLRPEEAEQFTLLFYVNSEGMARGGKKAARQYLVQDPGLWPQYVRTWNLYRYYVERSSQVDPELASEGKSALQLLLKDRRPRDDQSGAGLWDRFAFNLGLTARSIESLVDAYDYLGLFESAEKEADGLATTIADAIHPILLERLVGDENFIRKVREVKSAPTEEAAGTLASRVEEPVLFHKRFVQQLSNALVELPHGGVGPDADSLLDLVLPSGRAEQLRDSNKEIYDLLAHFARLNVLLTASLLPIILREALLRQDAKGEKAKEYLVKDRSQSIGRQLHTRIAMGLESWLDGEIDRVSKGEGGEVSYVALVKALLELEAGGQPRARRTA